MVLVICLMAIGLARPAAPQSAEDWLIVPGRSLGRIHIGEEAEPAMRRLGTADTGEGAAGHSWATWFGHSDRTGRGRSEIDLYTTLAEGSAGRKVVRIVRATSPSFHTRDGVSTRSDLARIRNAFPHIRRIAAYRPDPGGPVIVLYDDTRRGIAFEVMQDDGICFRMT
jgi:hypothetical protein